MKSGDAKHRVDLSKVTFGAKIDFLTIQTTGKHPLPSLSCKAIWPRRFHGRQLTLHDPKPSDVQHVISCLGAARLLELEIAIDIRPKSGVPLEEREKVLKAAMLGLFAARLDPSSGRAMQNQFRAFYRRLEDGYLVRPFNKALPRETDQQLHGGRRDPAQVKGYLKRQDQSAALPDEKHVARVEVRLSGEGLEAHGLYSLSDLVHFRYRKSLMPYFTHIRGTRRMATKRRGGLTATGRVLAQKSAEMDLEVWDDVGVGGFCPGGRRQDTKVILLADLVVNDRLGQCLTRLEQRFCSEKFVRLSETCHMRK